MAAQISIRHQIVNRLELSAPSPNWGKPHPTQPHQKLFTLVTSGKVSWEKFTRPSPQVITRVHRNSWKPLTITWGESVSWGRHWDHSLRTRLRILPLAISPLNSVPKTDASERRIILDLSFPPGRGVNDGIAREQFLGEPYKLSLSGTDNMTQLIHRKGQSCLLFKRDLSQAFRQFPVDPADLDKLGFEWQGTFT